VPFQQLKPSAAARARSAPRKEIAEPYAHVRGLHGGALGRDLGVDGSLRRGLVLEFGEEGDRCSHALGAVAAWRMEGGQGKTYHEQYVWRVAFVTLPFSLGCLDFSLLMLVPGLAPL